jgi:hypothetical protein
MIDGGFTLYHLVLRAVSNTGSRECTAKKEYIPNLMPEI